MRVSVSQIAGPTADPERMWVMTTVGFYSVVEDREREGNVLVRARDRGDIDAIAARLGDAEVLATPSRDYAFRVSVPRAAWADALRELAEEVDYDNFKSAVGARQGHARARVYGSVWQTLLALQR